MIGRNIGIAMCAVVLLGGGCAELTGPKYGESGGAVAAQSADRLGRIVQLESTKVDEQHKLGIGTVVGAVAGGLLGSQVGSGSGKTVATVAGAVAGGAAGTVAESKLKKKDAQRVTVEMSSGGQVTIIQPPDTRLRNGLAVRVEGSGETARVVPR